ncbi:hypothetical protein QYM36_004604 [Artemia franciscana]|uniref:phosphatidate phosphatase n=1 Tax=Artemia franciscana TaxID=6661 RepID=A0AA88I337_ARTSF|nr:hypothetical protein QYM36_004604 [Artemia franciscana]
MSIIGKVLESVKTIYSEINPATLSGAIDVIVVKQKDGTYTCSPFHVRFGKMGVLRSKEKVVDILVNGETVDIHMKLGESGEAFFVEEILEAEECPPFLVTSPIPAEKPDDFADTQFPYRNRASSEGAAHRKPPDVETKTVAQTDSDILLPSELETYNFDKNLKPCHVSDVIESGNKSVSAGHLNDSLAGEQINIDASEKIADVSAGIKSSISDGMKVFKAETVRCGEIQGSFKPIQETDEPEQKSVTKRRKKKRQTKKRNPKSRIKKGSISSSEEVCEPSPANSDTSEELAVVDDETQDANKISKEALEELVDDNLIPDWSKLPQLVTDKDRQFYSDTETYGGNVSGRGSPVVSDSEYEKQTARSERISIHDEKQPSWNWGELPNNPQKNTPASYSLMQHKKAQFESRATAGEEKKVQPEDDDVESGHGLSLPNSPTTIYGYPDRHGIESDLEEGRDPFMSRQTIELSLCGGLDDYDEPPEDLFLQSIVSFDDLAENPKVIDNPALVIRIGSKYYNRATALPIIMSWISFNRSLPQSVIDNLVYENMTKPREEKKKLEQHRSRSWFPWSRATETKKSNSETTLAKKVEIEKTIEPGKEQLIKKESVEDIVEERNEGQSFEPKEKELVTEQTVVETETIALTEQITPSEEIPASEEPPRKEKCKKSLRLTSDQIAKLNLVEGSNEVQFSVTTAYQGTTRCTCHIYLWRWDDKVVISDIDGTITKSDVLGHILPIVGRTWAQSGVAQLFTNIFENGYKILYLSARAIGQAQITRDYLRSLKQGDLALPDGPILLNPTSLMNALHREVIERKPEEFKIACLKDIQSLFPSDSNPFYAGYGNRVNDIWAYNAIGINQQRIFTINPKGELKRGVAQTFYSSPSNYVNQSTLVDHVFPPVRQPNQLDHSCVEFSQFNYWKEPIPEFNEEILEAVNAGKK